MCGCSLSVGCSMGGGYSCHIGLGTIEGYFIWRAVVLAYIYGISFTTPARVAVVAPRWTSGLSMLWLSWGCIPWQRCILWLRWLATMAFQSPVSNLVTFGAMGIPCRAICSASWVLLCAIGAVLGGCGWCNHYHCDWCWLLSACQGRLHPQVWCCGRLVLEHAEW